MPTVVFDCETIPDPRYPQASEDGDPLKPGCQQVVAFPAMRG